MNGVHDMGGMHGFGAVEPPVTEPVFEYEWQRRAMAMFVAISAGEHFYVDEFRHAVERMQPVEYLSTSYYEHWLHALELLMVEKGLLTAAELSNEVERLRRLA